MIARAALAASLAMTLAASMCQIDPIFDTAAEATRLVRCGDYDRREAELKALSQAGRLRLAEFEMLVVTREQVLRACDPGRPGTAADVLSLERALLWARALIDEANRRP